MNRSFGFFFQKEVLCFLLLLLSACGTSCGLDGRSVLPITMVGGAPMVAVTINDRRANLLLDTGADATVLGRSVASVLGVRPRPGGITISSSVGGSQAVEHATVDRLQVADQRFDALGVTLADVPIGDGVLGLDVLSRYDLEVDLSRGEAFLHHGSVCPGQLPPMRGAILEIPAVRGVLRAEQNGVRGDPYLMVPVSLDDAKAFAVLDTGALAGTLVSQDFAAHAGVSAAGLAGDPTSNLRGFGSQTPVRLHRFGELLVGREIFQAPAIFVGGALRAQIPVILGADYFRGHRVWFGFVGGRVFVTPAG